MKEQIGSRPPCVSNSSSAAEASLGLRRAATVDIFLDALIAKSEPVEIHFLWRPQLRDAGDEMVLEAAVNGGVGAIVTFNRRDYGSAPGLFGIEVLLPKEALLMLRELKLRGARGTRR